MDRGGNVTVNECQSIIFVDGSWLIRKTGLMERAIEPIPTPVTGKNSTRAIPAMRGRSQTDNEQPRLRITKTRHRLTRVLLLTVALHLLVRDAFAMSDKPGAEGTGNHPLFKLRESVHNFPY